MKRKYLLITLLVLFFTIVSILFILYVINKDIPNDIQNRNSLKIISTYKEYLSAIDKHENDFNQYAVFKELEYNDYKKLFVLKNTAQTLETRFICWTDEKLYYFGTDPIAYDIETGKIENNINLNILLNNIPGRIDRILGVSNNLIYYEFSHNADTFFANVDLDLTKVSIINKNELPTELQK